MTKSALALALGSIFTVAVATTPVYAGEPAPEAPATEEAVEETKGMSEAAPEAPATEEAAEETKGMSEAAPEEAEEAAEETKGMSEAAPEEAAEEDKE